MDPDKVAKEIGLFGVDLGLFLGDINHFHNALGYSPDRDTCFYEMSGHDVSFASCEIVIAPGLTT
jgi:hypothetical protein